MKVSKCLLGFAITGMMLAASACTESGADRTKQGVDKTLDAAKNGADHAIDATQHATDKAAATVSETASKVTDGWITTKLKAKFSDETALNGSHIDVDTSDHVVTLKGSVKSSNARNVAATIARGTEGVTLVVNELTVISEN